MRMPICCTWKGKEWLCQSVTTNRLPNPLPDSLTSCKKFNMHKVPHPSWKYLSATVMQRDSKFQENRSCSTEFAISIFTSLSRLTARLAEIDCWNHSPNCQNSLLSKLSELTPFSQVSIYPSWWKLFGKLTTAVGSQGICRQQHSERVCVSLCTCTTQSMTAYVRQLCSITVTASDKLSLDKHLRDCPRLRDR